MGLGMVVKFEDGKVPQESACYTSMRTWVTKPTIPSFLPLFFLSFFFFLKQGFSV